VKKCRSLIKNFIRGICENLLESSWHDVGEDLGVGVWEGAGDGE